MISGRKNSRQAKKIFCLSFSAAKSWSFFHELVNVWDPINSITFIFRILSHDISTILLPHIIEPTRSILKLFDTIMVRSILLINNPVLSDKTPSLEPRRLFYGCFAPTHNTFLRQTSW